MAHKRIASHVRTHRKKSGLTQRELARLLAHSNVGKVSRHERGVTIPSLPVALGYETIFRVPVTELFPAIHEAVTKDIEARLANFESALGKKSAKDRDAHATAQKLQFIWARKNGINI
jgi:DNA-binding XRE family transcriptional regulator